jgi:hypothetical protein
MNVQSKIALFWAAAATVFALCGCAGSRELHALPNSAFDEQISRAVPIATSMSEAQDLLISRGYRCFRGVGSDPRPLIACVSRRRTFGAFTPKDWQITLYYDANDRVTEIVTSVYPAYDWRIS